jgi:hypothetical protein
MLASLLCVYVTCSCILNIGKINVYSSFSNKMSLVWKKRWKDSLTIKTRLILFVILFDYSQFVAKYFSSLALLGNRCEKMFYRENKIPAHPQKEYFWSIKESIWEYMYTMLLLINNISIFLWLIFTGQWFVHYYDQVTCFVILNYLQK